MYENFRDQFQNMEQETKNEQPRTLKKDLVHKQELSKMQSQRKNIRVVAKPRANQNGENEQRPRPAVLGLDGVVSRRAVFEQLAESQSEERPSTKRQLSAESVAKCVSVSKRRDAVPHAETHASKALTHSGPAAKPGKPLARRRFHQQLFKSTDVFQRVDTYAINAGKELREQCIFSAPPIAQCVTRGARSELEKLRAIWVWLCHNIEYDLDGYLGLSPKLCSPDEVIKEGRGVCSGYSSICLEMCREVGIKCQEVSGFSKGIGYQLSGRRARESDHMWNVVWLEGQWWLLDACWGAGRVDMLNKTFIKCYDDFFFLTEPSEFIDTHFPDQSEWQLLDTPLSWEKFEKRAITSSAFYSLGLKLKQHHQVTTDAGEANVCMSFARPMSVTYELRPHHARDDTHTTQCAQSDAVPQRGAPEQGDSRGSFARLSLTSLGMSLQLTPPEAGSYDLRLFARPLSASAARHCWVCTVEVVCPVAAETEEVPPNPFLSWGVCVDAGELGVECCSTGSDVVEVGEGGEWALTVQTSRPLMMLCELAHTSLEPALAKRCLVTQIATAQLVCHVVCPLRGFYRLSAFVRDYDSSDGKFQNVGNFLLHCRNACPGPESLFPPNLTPWCGPGIRTQQAGLTQFSHAGPVVSLPQGRCNISFHKDSPDLQVHAGLSVELHQETTDLSAELQEEALPLSRHLFLTQMDGKVTVSVSAPRRGVYRLSLYGRTPPQQDYVPLCEFVLRSSYPEPNPPFPAVYSAWGRGCVLLEPRGGVLLAGQQVAFRVRVPGARSVCVIGEKHAELKMNKSRVWEGHARAGHGTLTHVKLAAATVETDSMAILLTWDVRNLPNEL
ncbi:kyphoscoliosis peptidase [Alosa pseudoharengus]|uniref:kyphoscoliosis peptidase n=1 Tax=Alosa pseudoharengus TaxID=34774 RepID=UPI003F8CE608